MNWDLASGRGLSKYGHLGDGCIDLILVDSVPRKDFYRFIKRHTNEKNQLDLPFVKYVRIKEAKIQIKNVNENFNAYSPVNYATSKMNDRLTQSFSNNATFIKDFDSDDYEGDEKKVGNGTIFNNDKFGKVFSIKSIEKKSANGSIETQSINRFKNNSFMKRSKVNNS